MLLGHEISVEYVLAGVESRSSVYFITPVKQSTKPISKIYCIADSDYLFKNDLWETIFRNLFEINYERFQSVWFRLVNAFDNPSYWEHHILSVISLMDSMLALTLKADDNKLTNSKFRLVRSKLNKFLMELEDKENKLVIQSISEQLRGLKNTQFGTLGIAFQSHLNSTDEDIKKIINLDIEQFSEIKKIRDKIAHGSKCTAGKGEDLTHEFRIISKLLVYILYHAYLDLGFSKKDFVFFLRKTFNPVLWSADLDNEGIDKVNKPQAFFELFEPDFALLTKHNYRTAVIRFNSNEECYSVCENHSQSAQNWFATSGLDKNLECYLASLMTDSEYKRITYVGAGYLCHSGKCYSSHTVVILDASNVILEQFPNSRTLELNS